MAMKKIYLLVLVTLAVAGCQKDSAISSDKLYLSVEGMRGGEKLAVEGSVSYWASGDRVRINEEVLTVSIDESAGTAVATSSGTGFSTPYRGVYPSSIYSGNSDKEHYTLNLPANYTYATTTHYSRTLQNLQAPMVAYTDEGTNLKFKHVTGAVAVQVVNYYGFTIEVDSIVVTSTASEGNAYNLCGMTAVTLSNGAPVVNANRDGVDSTKSVKMKFNGADHLQIFAGDSAVVQIPVLPVGDGNKFNVLVGVHKVDQLAVKKNFVRTQTTGGAMPRAKMGYARFTTGGLFTINSSGKKVIISQGNLQYIGSAATPYWQFATRQYGFLGDNGQITAGENKDRDLFCWATSGWNNGNYLYYPYSLPASYVKEKGYGFGPTDGSNYKYSLVGVYDSADWGVYNKIRNGGNESGRWRTLTGEESGEWYYMLTSRNLSYKYVQATVNDVKGLILFPDDYSHPGGISFVNLNTLNNYYTLNVFTEEQWVILETAGAVFFPLAGHRTGTATTYTANQAYYWTSSASSVVQNAYYIRLGPYSNSTGTQEKRYSCPVRLVHDVN